MNILIRYRLPIVFLFITGFSSLSHAAYEQRIYYVGMSCASIQKDSVLTPANEIFIHTHVNQFNNASVHAQSHPKGSPGYYKKVIKGFHKRERTLLWEGKQQPVALRVTMWEHDNGGTAVHVFSNYLTIFLTGKVTGDMPEGGSVGGPSNDPVTTAFKNAGDSLFGTGNDFMGYQRVYLGKGNWAGEPRKKRGEITYNFVTHHRKGGANCQAYFLFERGKEYKESLPTPKKPQPHNKPASNYNQPPYINEQEYQQVPSQTIEQSDNGQIAEPVPLTNEQRGYKVWLKNECKKNIFVAYRFKSFVDNAWVTAGWTHLGPGEKKLPKIYTENTVAYFHSDSGKIQNDAGYAPIEYPVVDDEFNHIQGTTLNGTGLRTMPFHKYRWRASQIENTVKIAECSSHQDKRVIEEGETDALAEALFELARKNSYQTNSIDKLVKKGAPINYRNLKGETPIFFTIRAHNSFSLGGFIRNGADVNIKDDQGNTPLHVAVLENNRTAIKMLIQKGADVNGKNKVGLSVLDLALSKNNAEITGLLVSAGAKKKSGLANKQFKGGNTLLHDAAIRNDSKQAAKLIKEGANVNAVNQKGRTPLYSTQWSDKHFDMVVLLLNQGADPNIMPRKGSEPLLQRVIRQRENKQHRIRPYDLVHKEKMIELLLDHGAEINAQNSSGDTALHKLVYLGQTATIDLTKIINFMAKEGINVNTQNKRKETALHVAVTTFYSYNRPDSRIDVLLTVGADPNIKNKKGEAALHVILNSIINECLLNNNVGCRTEQELNVMYDKVKLLITKGADIFLADNQGNTPKKLVDKIKNRKLRKQIDTLLSQ